MRKKSNCVTFQEFHTIPLETLTDSRPIKKQYSFQSYNSSTYRSEVLVGTRFLRTCLPGADTCSLWGWLEKDKVGLCAGSGLGAMSGFIGLKQKQRKHCQLFSTNTYIHYYMSVWNQAFWFVESRRQHHNWYCPPEKKYTCDFTDHLMTLLRLVLLWRWNNCYIARPRSL